VLRFPLPPHPIAAGQARIMTRLALADMDGVADDGRNLEGCFWVC
jgi:hypothetical protein